MSIPVFLFPGQGSQAVGMAKDLYESSAAARALIDQADKALAAELGKSLKTVMFEGPEEALLDTALQQPAIVLASLASLEALKELTGRTDMRPPITAGLSLGEYSALAAAGAMEPLTAVRLVAIRGRLMAHAASLVKSSMASVIADDLVLVKTVCAEVQAKRGGAAVVAPANYNSPGQVAIAGDLDSLEAVIAELKAKGVRRIFPLKVSGAFHTTLMGPAVQGLSDALAKADIRDAQSPVLANVSAKPVKSAGEIRHALVEQLTHPVLWSDSIQKICADGHKAFVEMGPGKVLAGLLKRTVKEASILPGGTSTEIQVLAAGLK
ncbi:MAG TPA: ACP S-malonyltransferase [Planctomycetota bacterium]|nr:ACP S-malonyltransferase [Planctomycetota bacterium]